MSASEADPPGDSPAADSPPGDSVPGDSATPRRRLRLILGLLLVAGAALLIALNQVWHAATVQREAPLPPLGLTASGADLVPLGVGIGVLLLASTVAVAATRGPGRRVIAVVVTICVGWLAVVLTRTLSGDLDAATAAAGSPADPDGLADAGVLGPILAYAGCAAGLVGGVLLWAWARQLPRMGERYEPASPSGPRGEAEGRTGSNGIGQQRDRWRTLDRGDDPTL